MLDERTLFDRFHEALDVEPRPGAYERLRIELTSKPVVLKRRPLFRMRFSKMGLRMTAALAAVLIAIALIVTFIIVRNPAVGEVPASDVHNLSAYRAMVIRDDFALAAAESDHCNSIDDTGCAAAVRPVNAALQRWIGDLAAFKTPPPLVALDTALRAHLQDGVDDLNAAVQFQKNGDVAGFNLAMNAATNESGWIDPVVSGLAGTAPGTGLSYHDGVDLAKQWAQGCMGGTGEVACVLLLGNKECTSEQTVQCEVDLQIAGVSVRGFLVDMAQHSAPASQAATYAKIQTDLVQIDAALLAIQRALLHRASLIPAETDFQSAISAAQTDLAAIT